MKLKDLLPEGFVVMYKVRKDLKNVNIGQLKHGIKINLMQKNF